MGHRITKGHCTKIRLSLEGTSSHTVMWRRIDVGGDGSIQEKKYQNTREEKKRKKSIVVETGMEH